MAARVDEEEEEKGKGGDLDLPPLFATLQEVQADKHTINALKAVGLKLNISTSSLEGDAVSVGVLVDTCGPPV